MIEHCHRIRMVSPPTIVRTYNCMRCSIINSGFLPLFIDATCKAKRTDEWHWRTWSFQFNIKSSISVIRFNSMQGLCCKSNAADTDTDNRSWHWPSLTLTVWKKLVLMWPWLAACNALPSASLQWCRKTMKNALDCNHSCNRTLSDQLDPGWLFTAHIDSAWEIITYTFFTCRHLQTDHVSSPTANKPGLNLHSWHSRHHRPRLSCCIDREAPSIDRFNNVQYDSMLVDWPESNNADSTELIWTWIWLWLCLLLG